MTPFRIWLCGGYPTIYRPAIWLCPRQVFRHYAKISPVSASIRFISSFSANRTSLHGDYLRKLQSIWHTNGPALRVHGMTTRRCACTGATIPNGPIALFSAKRTFLNAL